MSTVPGAAGADALAALGPFFAVETHAPGAVAVPPWRPVSSLTEPAGPLRDRVASVRATLAARGDCPVSDIDPRVAASAVHLGIVARLVAPAIGAAVLGAGIGLHPRGMWWQDGTGGPVPLSVPAPGDPAPGRLLDDLIVPLTAAVADLIPVSGRVLRGNVASGVNAAAGQIAQTRPDLASAAWDAARALRASPWLEAERCPPGPEFRRSSCCLFYRLAPAGAPRSAVICGDCVLTGA